MKLDIATHNPDQAYILGLCLRTGMEIDEIARAIGATEYSLRAWLSGNKSSQIPYYAQFALEALAEQVIAYEFDCCDRASSGTF